MLMFAQMVLIDCVTDVGFPLIASFCPRYRARLESVIVKVSVLPA